MKRALDPDLFQQVTAGDPLIFLQMYDHYPIGVILVDAAARVVYFNPAQLEIDGLAPADVLGKNMDEVYGLSKSGSVTLYCLSTRQPVLNQWLVYTNPRGTAVRGLVHAFPLFKNGALAGCLATTRHYPEADEIDHFELGRLIQPAQTPDQIGFEHLVGAAAGFKSAIRVARNAAAGSLPVLIHGETGVGKELFARGIHNTSERRGRPFVPVNCAAIPESLFEGMMFGVSRGAFTGAVERPGFFEEADGGSIFLDELDSMPPAIQPKFLRVLQEQAFHRLGSNREKRIDVRIISALGTDPARAVAQGRLRSDLFFRLGAVQIRVPPLREREGDVAHLLRHFIAKHTRRLGRKIKNPSLELLNLLKIHSWPGNVRELEHVVMGAMAMASQRRLTLGVDLLPEHFKNSIFAGQPRRETYGPADETRPGQIEISDEKPFTASTTAQPAKPTESPAPGPEPSETGPYRPQVEDFEKNLIIERLRSSFGNVALAARMMGLAPQTLHYKLKRLGLKAADFKYRGLHKS